MPSYHTSQAKITHLKEYLIMKNQNNTQAELQSQIDSLNGEVYDCLTLNREHLTMLWKMVDTAIDDLTATHDPSHAIKQAKRALFIAQHLAIDFLDCIDGQIEKHPCHEVEGKA